MRTTIYDFDDLVGAMYSRIFSFAYRLTRNRQDAADVTQEAFVRAYKARAGIKPDRKPDGWLLKIVYRCFLDSRKGLRRRPEVVSFEDMCLEKGRFDPPDSAQDPEKVFFSDKLGEPMTRALACLSDEQRRLIYLAHFAELSHQELSKVYGCGATTIGTRIHRTHLILRRNLALFGM